MSDAVLTAAAGTGTARDFDFFMGSWKVHNRRLRDRLVGSDKWDEFEATSVARPLLDGLGNEDEFRTDFAGGFIGMSFRFFDPEQRRWSIYWADTRRCGELDPPVFGSISGDTGSSSGRTRSTAARSSCASSGPESPRRRRTGSRPSPTTPARHGRPTG